MKKIILAVCLIGITSSSFAQMYQTRTAKVIFDATTKSSPEKISAVNNEVAAILNPKAGDFVFQLLVKSFKFEKELMQEHFNENYLESDKLPKSDFKGKITNIGDVNFSKDGTYNVTVAGKLTIHGVSKDVSVPGTITVKGKEATAKAKFSVKLADYKISIPSVVGDKVAKDATVSVDAAMATK
jgi:hypothetical protein